MLNNKHLYQNLSKSVDPIMSIERTVYSLAKKRQWLCKKYAFYPKSNLAWDICTKLFSDMSALYEFRVLFGDKFEDKKVTITMLKISGRRFLSFFSGCYTCVPNIVQISQFRKPWDRPTERTTRFFRFSGRQVHCYVPSLTSFEEV